MRLAHKPDRARAITRTDGRVCFHPDENSEKKKMSCLKCLKYTMCVVNFIFFLCGATVFGLGIYMNVTKNYLSLLQSISMVNLASALFVIGIFVTCVSLLGFLGALKENRCLLISFFTLLFLLMLAELTMACLLLLYEEEIDKLAKDELRNNLQKSGRNATHDWDFIQKSFNCCGVNNATDWGSNVPASCCPPESCQDKLKQKGCYSSLKEWLEKNLLGTGIVIIIVCSIEVLGMCFSMTLFCHISKSGLGYK